MRLSNPLRLRLRIALLAAASLLAAVSLALAQGRDEYGNVQGGSQNGDNGDVQQTVARISYIEGSVSYARGDDPDNWQAADRNVPVTLGDRVYTGDRSRLELQVQGGAAIRLGAQTDLAALNLTDDTRQFSVNSGVASFRIRRLAQDEVFEIDTPNAAITIEQPGDYRLDVDQDGNSRFSVRRGSATAAAGGGQVPLQSGDEIDIQGTDNPSYDVVALGAADAWDQWVSQREDRITRSASLKYVSNDVEGVDDLDQYGRWQQVPQYGWAWSPASIAADWVPYRDGHWIWQDPWGWTWVSAEPWGWAPYHYGRWVTSSSRWYWVPLARTVRIARYSPALVAFVGGGPGWSGTVAVGGGGFVGWFPLGPRDPFNRWWGRRGAVNVNVTNVTYVNRTYVTVVNQKTFVSGGVVTGAFVRDRAVVRQIGAAPVLRGPLPMVPTAASLHVAVRTGLPAPPRPPAAIVARAVVARVAPPPAPPTFQAKLAVIRENRGAPVAAAQAAKISVENRGRPQAVTNIRPVSAEAGRVTLAPRAGVAGAQVRKVEPITAQPARGRAVATAAQPVSNAPVTSNVRGANGVPNAGRPQTIDRGTVQRATPPPVKAGQPQNLERRNVSPVERAPVTNDTGRGRQPQVESRQIRPTPGGSGVGGPPPQPTARTLQRQENVVPRNDRIARPTPSTNRGNQPVVREVPPQTHERVERPTPSTPRGNQPVVREAQPQTRERLERPTPVPRNNTSGEGTSNDGGRGRERRVVTPEPQGRTGNPNPPQPQRVERQANPRSPETNSGVQKSNDRGGDRGKKNDKPKPEKTPKK